MATHSWEAGPHWCPSLVAQPLVPGCKCCTCVYLARISWGHMLGVRAEKGPQAEGTWLPKIKENQE